MVGTEYHNPVSIHYVIKVEQLSSKVLTGLTQYGAKEENACDDTQRQVSSGNPCWDGGREEVVARVMTTR